MTKLAAKKTAGVLGDDLALNAQQVSGIQAEREIPVILAVAKGSFKNKLILVPTALALSAFAPKLIPPLLMLGGGYLVYEGFEKIYHKLFYKPCRRSRRTKRGTTSLSRLMILKWIWWHLKKKKLTARCVPTLYYQ